MADTLETNCPSCSARLRLPVAQAGKQVRCPKCKTVFRIPEASAAPDPGFDSMLGDLTPQQPAKPPAKPAPASAFGPPSKKDPFGPSTPAYQDPFGAPAGPDPFAVPPKKDPFGAPAGDPFGAPAQAPNPFGAPPVAAPNPFAPNPYASPAGGYAPPPTQTGNNSPLPGISLGTGIAAWLFMCVCSLVSIVLSLTAIITGHIALASKTTNNRGLAIAGLILGYLNLLAIVAIVVIYVFILIAAENQNPNFNNPNF